MVYREINYGHHKAEIRSLLREKLKLKERVVYHTHKIDHHKAKIEIIQNTEILELNEKIDYLINLAKVSGKDI